MDSEPISDGPSWLKWLADMDYQECDDPDEVFLTAFIEAANDDAMCAGVSRDELERAIRNLWMLLSGALHNRRLDLSLRRRTLECLPGFFERCAQLERDYTQPMYYFWDGLSISDPELRESLLQALEGQLSIDNVQYRGAALFGLREYSFGDSAREAVLVRFLERQDIDPGNRAEAENIRMSSPEQPGTVVFERW